MSSLIKVTHNNQLVLTTAQVAERFGTDSDRIMQNFNRNAERFTEGKDYYLLTGQDLKDFKNYLSESKLVSKHAPELYLWTERGSLKHMKILGTDEAWDGHEILVNTYFHVKEIKLPSYMIEDPITRAEKWIEEQKEKQENFTHMKKVTNSSVLTAAEKAKEIINANVPIKPRKDKGEYSLKQVAKLLGVETTKGKPHITFIGDIITQTLEILKGNYDGDYYRSGIAMEIDHIPNIVVKKTAIPEIKDFIEDWANFNTKIVSEQLQYTYKIPGKKNNRIVTFKGKSTPTSLMDLIPDATPLTDDELRIFHQ